MGKSSGNNMTKDQLAAYAAGAPCPHVDVMAMADEITQLRGNLSLAEEGLASVMQERLEWAMVCECSCAACEKLSSTIRNAARPSHEPCAPQAGMSVEPKYITKYCTGHGHWFHWPDAQNPICPKCPSVKSP